MFETGLSPQRYGDNRQSTRNAEETECESLLGIAKDVSYQSDNVLCDSEGRLFFIDPIIKLKKPALEVWEYLYPLERTMVQVSHFLILGFRPFLQPPLPLYSRRHYEVEAREL